MFDLLVGLVVILSFALVVGGFLGGPIMARERKKTNAAKDKLDALTVELLEARKAGAKALHQVREDTETITALTAERDVLLGQVAELASSHAEVARLTEYSGGLNALLVAEAEQRAVLARDLDVARDRARELEKEVGHLAETLDAARQAREARDAALAHFSELCESEAKPLLGPRRSV
jgi:chromosome segregation ATPase